LLPAANTGVADTSTAIKKDATTILRFIRLTSIW
jgi:hypothetical protein